MNAIPEIGKPTTVRFDQLIFDKRNPRLVTGDDWDVRDDVALVSAYREIAALDELVLSIMTNTYLNFDPLIVCGPDSGPFEVLEGNRRLAAMKVLADPDLARECKISVPQNVTKRVLDSFKNVLVVRVADAKDAEAFIGFKHINGPQRWDAYAKARFVTDWYHREKSAGLTVDKIAHQIGDTNDTVRSYIGAILVLDQAQNAGIFEIKDRFNKGKLAFSHLYTGLDRLEFRGFLGLEPGWNSEPLDKPIPVKKLEALGEVLRYIYGSKRDKIKPHVQSQNPNLAQLGRCLSNETALLRLRSGASLATAFAEIEGGSMFNHALGELMAKAEKAMGLASKYDGNPLQLEFIKEVQLKVNTVEGMMKARVGQLQQPLKD